MRIRQLAGKVLVLLALRAELSVMASAHSVPAPQTGKVPAIHLDIRRNSRLTTSGRLSQEA